MSTSFNKIIHFSRLVKTSGRVREFNFRKNNNAGDYVFDVDTVDDRGNRILFRLAKQDTEWHLSSQHDLPDWITNNVEQLGQELETGVNEN